MLLHKNLISKIFKSNPKFNFMPKYMTSFYKTLKSLKISFIIKRWKRKRWRNKRIPIRIFYIKSEKSGQYVKEKSCSFHRFVLLVIRAAGKVLF